MASKYESRISPTANGAFYALIVRIDRDGQEQVVNTYKGRHFVKRETAEKSTSKAIAKFS